MNAQPVPSGAEGPLAGRRVLVTRPRAQAAAFVEQLEHAGARVVTAPTIRVAPPLDREPLLAAAAHVNEYDWIVFASSNAVDAFCAALDAASARIDRARVCAVGSKTAERLRDRGVDVAVVPPEFRAESLADAIVATGPLAGARVLIPRSEIGREVTAERLRAAGALVTDVVAYRTVPEAISGDTPDVRAMLTRGELDAVTFTSGSSVRNFVQMYGEDVIALLRSTTVAVIGPVTAEAAREEGIHVAVEPHVHTTEAMVAALGDYFAAQAAK